MPPSDPNPYASPAAPEREVVARDLTRLRRPALILLYLAGSWGGLGVVFALLVAGRLIWWRWTNPGAFERSLNLGANSGLFFHLIVMLASCYTAYGAWCMRRGIRYWDAFTAATMACVPVISPWQILGIPFGIWALVVLCRRDVRAAFDAPH